MEKISSVASVEPHCKLELFIFFPTEHLTDEFFFIKKKKNCIHSMKSDVHYWSKQKEWLRDAKRDCKAIQGTKMKNILEIWTYNLLWTINVDIM